LSSATGSMKSTANSASGSIQSALQGTWDAITSGAQNLWDTLTGHSIWPEMLGEMVSQTEDAMSQIQGAFGTGLAGVAPIVQTNTPTMAPPPAAVPASPTTQEITIPIIVQLDGQQIQTFLERRLVESIFQNASRSRRGTV
jgi:hypothetical protein